MKSAWVAVLVCVVLTSAAFAQITLAPTAIVSPRSLGMGGAGIGVADDGAAWFQNPAGLGALNLCAAEGKKMANDIIGNISDTGDSGFGLTWSGWNPEKKQGFGAGYFKSEWSMGVGDIGASIENKQFGAGYGAAFKNSPLSWGVSVLRTKLDATVSDADESVSGELDSTTTWNLGLLYQFAQPEKAPIRVGLTVTDLTSETQGYTVVDDEVVAEDLGPFFNLGVAWPAAPQWLVAVDVTDITGETEDGPFFSGGVEYCFAGTPWKARAGFVDTGDGHDLTLGAGYAFGNQWRADAAWANTDEDNTWSIGAGFSF